MSLTISYSIFFNSGRKTKNLYRDGLIKNAKKYKTIFPNAKMVVYHDDSVDDKLLTTLKEYDVILKVRPTNYNWSGTFWRFEEFDNIEKDDDIVLITDADTDIAVENLLLKKMVDNIGDYSAFVHHGGKTSITKIINEQRWIIACAAIFKGPLSEKISDKITSYIEKDKVFGNDERFLRDFVWPQIKEDCLINIEKRSLQPLKGIIKDYPNIVPKWMLENNFIERVFTEWNSK